MLSRKVIKLSLATKTFMVESYLQLQVQTFSHFTIGILSVLFEELMSFQKLFIGQNQVLLLLLLLKISFISWGITKKKLWKLLREEESMMRVLRKPSNYLETSKRRSSMVNGSQEMSLCSQTKESSTILLEIRSLIMLWLTRKCLS